MGVSGKQHQRAAHAGSCLCVFECVSAAFEAAFAHAVCVECSGQCGADVSGVLGPRGAERICAAQFATQIESGAGYLMAHRCFGQVAGAAVHSVCERAVVAPLSAHASCANNQEYIVPDLHPAGRRSAQRACVRNQRAVQLPRSRELHNRVNCLDAIVAPCYVTDLEIQRSSSQGQTDGMACAGVICICHWRNCKSNFSDLSTFVQNCAHHHIQSLRYIVHIDVM